MKNFFIKLLIRFGNKSISDKLFNSINRNNILLKDIRYMINKYHKDKVFLEKYIKLAIELYPDNSYGYIQYAKLKMKQKEYSKAYNMLKKSPTTREQKRILSELGKKMKNNNSKLKVESKPKVVTKKDIYEKSFEEEEKNIMAKLISNPFSEKLQEALLDLYLYFNKKDRLSKFIDTFSSTVDINKLSIIFKQSNAYQVAGDYISSLKCLNKAQKKYTGDRRVLFKIAEIYKFDNQIEKAYIMLKAGEIDNPTYGAVRRLSFEVDNLLLENAKETLDRILEYKLSDLSRYMTMINRVSAYFPEYANKLVETRLDVEKELRNKIFRSEEHFNKRFQYLLSGRYLKDLDILIYDASQKNIILSEESIKWYDKIKDFIDMDEQKSFLGWIEAANKNESTNLLYGIDKGLPFKIKDIKKIDKTTIELFIPNSIFTNPKNDKSSFKDINAFFKEIFLCLLNRDDIIIIPRHQYNWRYCTPKTQGRVLSYHTHSDENNPNWLHIQESTLSGYCSVDTQGFAGYSSISYDFSKIEEETKKVSTKILYDNYITLRKKYIENNISKYEQEEVKFKSSSPYVFVALQVLTDVVAKLAYINGVDLLKTVAESYKDSNIKVIVKRHPYCNSISIQKTVEDLEEAGLIETTNASIHSIIEGAKAVFTVNSGVGLESLMHLKSVIITGEADYAYAVYSKARTIKELKDIIKKDDFVIDKSRILKFLYYYTQFYIQNKESIKGILSRWLK